MKKKPILRSDVFFAYQHLYCGSTNDNGKNLLPCGLERGHEGQHRYLRIDHDRGVCSSFVRKWD